MNSQKIKLINQIINKVGKNRVIHLNDLVSKAGVKYDDFKVMLSKGYVKDYNKIDFGDKIEFKDIIMNLELRNDVVVEKESKYNTKVDISEPKNVINDARMFKVNAKIKDLIARLRVLDIEGVLEILANGNKDVIGCLNPDLQTDIYVYLKLVSDFKDWVTPSIIDKLIRESIIENYKEVDKRCQR